MSLASLSQPKSSGGSKGLAGLAGLSTTQTTIARPTRSLDLTSSEGLYDVAQRTGGSVAQKADEIVGNDQSLLGKIGGGLKTGLGKVLDLSQRFNYAGASAVKNIKDADTETTFLGGLKSGITGKTKNTYSDVFTEMGINPTSKLGKFSKGLAGFGLDVLLDPTTYITFGESAAAKVAVNGVERSLSKSGSKLLAKGVAQKSGQVFGEQFVKDAIGHMAEKSPEMYAKFIDQGGIKFFGQTLVSGGRIAGVAKAIPGMTKADELTKPVRNTLYALFHRDASAKFGKLPNEYIQLQQKFRDLGHVRGQEALNQVVEIAKANKLTAQEAELITNAIESKLPLADFRLENARKLIEQGLGRNLKAEQRAGIEVGELPNYVPHMLVDETPKAIPFKPTGVRVSLPASKERTIGKIAKTKPFNISVNNLISHEGAPDLAAVEKYKSEIQAGKKIEPLKIIKEGDKFGIEDGKHRFEAYKQLGIKEVPVVELNKITKGKDLERATIDEINSAFGKEFFDPNIINTAAIRSVASARAVASKEFLTEVAQKFGVAAEKAPTGYVEAGAKELAGLKFHPAISEQIDKFGKAFTGDEATNQLLRAFDKAQNLWKASVTSIFPAFHGRNAISNVFLNFLDIGSASLSVPKHILSGMLLNDNRVATNLEKEILKGGEIAKGAKTQLDTLLNKPVLTDDFGKKWTFKEIRKEIKDRRVAFGDEFTGFLDIRDGIKDKLGTAVTGGSKVKQVLKKVNPLSQNNIAFETGRKVGNVIEQQARVLNFMTNLERTGDVVTAAERTKQFLFDYTNLSDFEKNVMKRLIPFYTFTRKNLELQVTQLAKQPGKLATQAKLFSGVSDLLSGGQLSDEERKSLPQFLQEGLGIVSKRDGKNVTVINSLGLPIEQVFSNLKPNAVLGSLTPIAAVPLQIAIGKHFFFDKDLKDVNDATAFKNAPQFLKDYIGVVERKNKDGSIRYIATNPTRLFIINNIPPSSRVVSVIGQLEAQNVSGKLKILRQLTGIKPYGEDLDLQAEIKEKAKIRALQDLLDTTGVAPVFKRSFIPKK